MSPCSGEFGVCRLWEEQSVDCRQAVPAQQLVGASLSEPHTDVLAWDSVTRDIYIYI